MLVAPRGDSDSVPSTSMSGGSRSPVTQIPEESDTPAISGPPDACDIHTEARAHTHTHNKK